MFLLINSLFCQMAALAIPTLVLIPSSLFASSVIQLRKYLKCLTCSNGTPSDIILRCIPVISFALLTTITLVFLTLISIPYSLHALLNLSIIICIFLSFVRYQYCIVSISQIRNIDSVEFDAFYIFHGFLYHKFTVQVEKQRRYHTTVSYTPLHPYLFTDLSIPLNHRMLSPKRFMINLLSISGTAAFSI